MRGGDVFVEREFWRFKAIRKPHRKEEFLKILNI